MSRLKSELHLLITLVIFLCLCGQTRAGIYSQPLPIAIDTVSYTVLGQLKSRVLTIRDTIDLVNKKCILPEGITLKFKGGFIKNGTLEGNKTMLNSSKACFGRVRILGSWNVPIISTSLFQDLSYENALKDVVALSDSHVMNKIIVDPGDYFVSAYKNGDVCISIKSNTDFLLKGIIRLMPNDYRNYYIIQVEGSNISVRGTGTIIGDKHTHKGNSGEWGMGINLDGAHNVTISGLSIQNCWGDCIYIGNNSTNVLIKDCKLDHGRRQGISVSSVDGLVVRNCIITNVSGTAPEYGIDIEPNKNENIDHVKIEKVIIDNCEGGIQAWGRAPGASIGKVVIRKCSISGCSKMPIKIVKCSFSKVENCVTSGFRWNEDISFFDVDSVVNKKNRKKR